MLAWALSGIVLSGIVLIADGPAKLAGAKRPVLQTSPRVIELSLLFMGRPLHYRLYLRADSVNPPALRL
ncbi:MAG: hypothetical protein NVS3B21_24050 [Acidimicrobiales bacterium]